MYDLHLKTERCKVSRSLVAQVANIDSRNESEVVVGTEGRVRPVPVPERVILSGDGLGHGRGRGGERETHTIIPQCHFKSYTRIKQTSIYTMYMYMPQPSVRVFFPAWH